MGNNGIWRPKIGLHERYSRYALENMAPCSHCSDSYKQNFAELKGLVESAEMSFQLGYELYAELRRIDQYQREMGHKH